MGFLIYLLASTACFAGIPAGMTLIWIAPEEIKPSKRYIGFLKFFDDKPAFIALGALFFISSFFDKKIIALTASLIFLLNMAICMAHFGHKLDKAGIFGELRNSLWFFACLPAYLIYMIL